MYSLQKKSNNRKGQRKKRHFNFNNKHKKHLFLLQKMYPTVNDLKKYYQNYSKICVIQQKSWLIMIALMTKFDNTKLWQFVNDRLKIIKQKRKLMV